MPHPSCRRSAWFLPGVLFLCLGLASPFQLWSKGCAESLGPAQPPPASLWGDLTPEAILIDATRWTGSELPNNSYPISTSVDIENGWIFHTYYGGFSIWDARTNPAAPTRVALIGGHVPTRQFPSWPMLTEFTQVVFYVDVPDGDDTLAAVAAITPVGLSIWDTTSKTGPFARYQDTGRNSYQVYSARIGGMNYAFVADFQTSFANGLFVYDMSASRSYNACVENTVNGENNCPNVYLGRIGSAEASKYVHGLAVGNRHFVVRSGGDTSITGVSIWEVTDPRHPSLVVQDFRGIQNGSVHGVAMWTSGGQHYLALRNTKDSQDIAKIFDVTTCLTTGCSALQNLEVWRSQPLRPYPQSEYWLSVTFSRSNATPFLYLGSHDPCRDGEANFQTEYLLDVTNPAAPREVSPQAHIVDPPPPATDGRPVDYWSWYYSDRVRGWSHFAPRVARFNGPYLYRAAATIFDVHRWSGGVAPTAGFTWPSATLYIGDPVTFTNTSTGSPTSYSWTFEDGNTPQSAAPVAPPR